MESLIKINGLKYVKSDITILNNISFDISCGDFTILLGINGSGKSTLLKLLYKHNMKTISLFKELTIDLVTPSFNFSSDTVYELLLNHNSIKKDDVYKLAKSLGVIDILECRPSTLSYGMQCLVHLMESLIRPSDVLLIDGIIDGIDLITKQKVFKYLKKLNKDKKITIIYATDDSNSMLYFKKTILLKDGEIIYYGKMEDSFLNDELWKYSCIPYPFEVELSKKLKYYGLVDKDILSIDKLVNMLWK